MEIKVLIVDDSALVRQVISDIVSQKGGMRVIAAAANPIFARRYMDREWPDVIILDIEMPEKNGLVFLREIMAERPTPVIICSGVTENNAKVTMEALSSGAVSVISKPQIGMKDFLLESEQLLIDEIRSAANVNVKLLKTTKVPAPIPAVERKNNADVILSAPTSRIHGDNLERIIVLGASAGGTQAIETVLRMLPPNAPGIAIVQHMPEKFTAAFAERLNSLCSIEVKEAQSGDEVKPGRAIIAMGGRHMTLVRKGIGYIVEVIDGPLVSRHKPSVDVLFRSAAKNGSSNILGVILTGMGDDGASGLLEMRNAGSPTVGQDQETSVVYGMPREAFLRGGVEKVLPLDMVANEIVRFGQITH